jgi:hypothetical protein
MADSTGGRLMRVTMERQIAQHIAQAIVKTAICGDDQAFLM